MIVPRYWQLFGGSERGKEDPLTRDVFGALELLPRATFLSAVVEAIAAANLGSRLASERLETLRRELEDEDAEFRFWPGERAAEGLGLFPDPESGEDRTGTIPDLMITSKSFVFLIEAKLGAVLGNPVDQLPRQFAVGHECARAGGKEREFVLVAVTNNYVPPEVRLPEAKSGGIHAGSRKGSIEEAVRTYFDLAAGMARSPEAAAKAAELARRVDEGRTAWIGWPALCDVVREATGSIERHADPAEHETYLNAARRFGNRLLEAFALRGIMPFRGFAGIDVPKALEQYRGAPLLTKGWRLP